VANVDNGRPFAAHVYDIYIYLPCIIVTIVLNAMGDVVACKSVGHRPDEKMSSGTCYAGGNNNNTDGLEREYENKYSRFYSYVKRSISIFFVISNYIEIPSKLPLHSIGFYSKINRFFVSRVHK